MPQILPLKTLPFPSKAMRMITSCLTDGRGRYLTFTTKNCLSNFSA